MKDKERERCKEIQRERERDAKRYRERERDAKRYREREGGSVSVNVLLIQNKSLDFYMFYIRLLRST